ncbi:MAG: hypothetical protein KAX50_08210 [Saprospiraceae bacterium]|nr:hypothetical protein [Saprospiraceae bacterium]
MQLEALKLDMIRKIMDEQDVSRLEAINATLSQSHQSDREEILHRIAKPTRRKLDIEELKREQNYSEPNQERLEYLIKELAVEEPLEELLKMI